MRDWVAVVSEHLLIVAIVLAGLSGVPGLLWPREGRAGERLFAALMTVPARSPAPAPWRRWHSDGPASSTAAWSVPGGRLAVRVDALAAMFLIQIAFAGRARRRSTGSSTGRSASTPTTAASCASSTAR